MIRGRKLRSGAVVKHDYATSNSYVKRASTVQDGSHDTDNRVTISVNDLRYYLYLHGANYRVLCLDDDNNEVFDFDTGTSDLNQSDHALLVKPSGELAIFASYKGKPQSNTSDGIRIYTLNDNYNPTSVTTESESMSTWFDYGNMDYLRGRSVEKIAFEMHGGAIAIAVLPIKDPNLSLIHISEPTRPY